MKKKLKVKFLGRESKYKDDEHEANHYIAIGVFIFSTIFTALTFPALFQISPDIEIYLDGIIVAFFIIFAFTMLISLGKMIELKPERRKIYEVQ